VRQRWTHGRLVGYGLAREESREQTSQPEPLGFERWSTSIWSTGRLCSVALWSVLLVSLLRASVVPEDPYGFGTDVPWRTWRLIVGSVTTIMLVVRMARRAVIFSPLGVEGRRLLSTWHVPWADVADLVVPVRGRRERRRRVIQVVTVDGRERRAVVARRRELPMLRQRFGEIRREAVSPTSRSGPNQSSRVALLAAVLGVWQAAVADTGRLNKLANGAGELHYLPKELRELQIEIACGHIVSMIMLFAVVPLAWATAVWEYVRARRRHERDGLRGVLARPADGQ
jgi:hypothetical protein